MRLGNVRNIFVPPLCSRTRQSLEHPICNWPKSGDFGYRSMAMFAGRWLFGVLCLTAIGCGGADWHAETQPVKGTITINGENPEGAIVTLHPTADAVDVRKSKPWGLVGADGSYTIRTYDKGDGAPIGEYRATVAWLDDPTVPNSVDLLAGAYADPDQSQWTFTIEEGQAELPPIEIVGAKVIKSPKRVRRKPSPFDASADGM